MIELLIASAIQLAMVQSAAADSARAALRTCIKQAAEQAKTQKLPIGGFADFAHQQCADQESKFKAAVWAFDSKNKVSRKQSEEDAQLQIDDFVSLAAERLEMEAAPQQ